MVPKTLQLEFVTPERELAHEEVESVQLPALDGYIGVLPGHAPLLTELGYGALSFQRGGQTYYATTMGGFAEVLADRVIVLAEIAERAEDIDLNRAQAALDRAAQRLSKTVPAGTDWLRAAEAMRRSQVRLLVAQFGGGAATLLAERTKKHVVQ